MRIRICMDGAPAFALCGMLLFTGSAVSQDFHGWPEVENGGNWELGPPEAATDLKSMGFKLFNHANNHSTDWGVAGMRETDRLLDSLELVHAGTGQNLGQASRPGYFDSGKGRIALSGMATTFQPMERAATREAP